MITKSKIGSVLLSLAIAFGLWMYVITVVSPESEETFYNIPVILEGASVLEERGLMITDGEDQTISLRLSGNRSDLNELTNTNITLKADLSKIYEPGQAQLSYSITYPSNVPNNAFDVQSKSSNHITLTVENRVKQDIPVEIIYSGALAEDYISDRENAVLDYPTILVDGPQSVVDQIATARINVDLTDRSESISESYRYTLCDAEGNPVDAEMIKVNAEEVRLDMKIQRVKEITLDLTVYAGGGATRETAGITINPKTIRVCGNDTVLASLDVLNLGTINLADISNAVTIPFTINLPEGVTNLTGVTEATVDIKFPGLITKELTIERIKPINVPDGMKAEIITETLTVTVRGPADQVNRITAVELSATVDFKDMPAGTSTIKATIVIDEDYPDLGAVGTYSVSATLQNK